MGSKRVRDYILGHFNRLFFTLLFTFFFIATVILLIKIAGLTSIIKMGFYDLFLLYLYSLPMVLFYTIPVAFFVAATLALNKASYDNELFVLFSLGVSPKRIYGIFFGLALLISILLFLISIGTIPLSKVLYANFLSKLHKESSINIKPSEFGHKFGDFFVFVEDISGDIFKDVILYSKKGFEGENFVFSKEAIIQRDSNNFGITLKNGQLFAEKNETIYKIDFDKLTIFDTKGFEKKRYDGILSYWIEAFYGDKKRAKDLSASIITSLFPLLILHLILVFGITHHRIQKNRSYLYLILTCTIFYGLTYYVSITSPFFGSILLLVIWLTLSYVLYKLKIEKRF